MLNSSDYAKNYASTIGKSLGYEIWEVYAATTTTATRTTKTAKVLITETPILKEHYILFGTFLYLHCTTTTLNPRFPLFFFFFLLSLNEVSINSTPGKFAYT